MDDKKVERIRRLNDILRVYGMGGRVVWTGDLIQADDAFKAKVYGRLVRYRDWPESKDPHQEHDYGKMLIDGIEVMWKIDYYDRNLEFGSEDPSDPTQTKRVLSVFYARDY